jgi:uncharacterized membrane protein YphA (DoxX/SURF4 family)/thiol-disulfide isomerase/thioredoxin
MVNRSCRGCLEADRAFAILRHVAVALFSIRILLAAVFLSAAVGKFLDLAGSRRAMEEFGVPSGAAGIAGLALPLLELAVAIGLLFDPSARYAAAVALLLLLAFIAGIVRAISQGRAPDCHCFGQLHSEPAGPSTVLRNVFLAALVVPVIAAGAGPGIPSGLGHLSGAQVALAVAMAIAIVLGLACAALWGERRRLRRELDATIAAAQKPGLERGAQAPALELTPVRGTAATLDELTSNARPAVLVFVSTTCGPCVRLFPELARWQEPLAQSVVVAAVFSGQHEDVERVCEEHGLSIALAEEANEAFELFKIRGTPSAVLIDSDSRVGSSTAEGTQAIEALIRSALRRSQPPGLAIHQG